MKREIKRNSQHSTFLLRSEPTNSTHGTISANKLFATKDNSTGNVKIINSVLPTGSHKTGEENKVIKCQFGDYEVLALVNNDDKFVGIKSISIKKDFRDPETAQYRSIKYDVDGYYREDD